MASTQPVTLSGNTDIDALLTGFKWDTSTLTYSFPDSGWWYVLEQVADELDVFAVLDVLAGWLSDPTGSLINLLEDEVLGPYGDTAIVAIVSLNGFDEFNDAQKAAARFAVRDDGMGRMRVAARCFDFGDTFVDHWGSPSSNGRKNGRRRVAVPR